MKDRLPRFYNAMISFLTCVISLIVSSGTYAQSGNIKNDRFWDTKDGQPIYSQGGGIFRFKDPATGSIKYYWYGVHYAEADKYRQGPNITYNKQATFASVTCYSSTDLVNWRSEGDVLNKDELSAHAGKGWVGRLGVAYIESLKKYALITQHGMQLLFTVADSPTGPFTWHQEISMEPFIGTSNTGDQTVFTDEDTGKSYLVYSYGKGRSKIYVSEIGVKNGKVDLLDCTQVYKGDGREGNCMFRYKGKYYMCASNLYGWDASFAYYLVADNIRGPYRPANEMQVMNGCADDFAHVTQTGFFVTVKGSEQETVIYCGDRWSDFAGNGLGYNQWCPLSFNGSTPYFNSLSSWDIDTRTGSWNVATDNNYIKNGSFEADRKTIPSSTKPLQQQLTGWTTLVTEGGQPEAGNPNSAILNHSNSEEERKIVTGEKSLNIGDKVNFKRKVFQAISSSPYAKLEDGYYDLTAKIRNSGGFNVLKMYASSQGNTVEQTFKEENPTWKTIRIAHIPLKGGKAEIGFLAEGQANSFCYVDDVSLVRSN